jgi:spermidine/putrescine transport system substrate-binding protein
MESRDFLIAGGSRRRALSPVALALGVAMALAFSLAACGGSDEEGGGQGAVSATPPETKPDQLIVRTWAEPWNTTLEKASTKFTADTGIPVEFDLTDESPTQTKVRAAIKAGDRPPVDVVNNLATWAFISQAQGLTVPLNPEIVTNLDKVTPAAEPTDAAPITDAGWPYVNLYGYSTPIVYDADRVDPSEITSWEDLFDPKWEGRLGIEDYYYEVTFPVAKMIGEDPSTDPELDATFEKLNELQPNIGAVVNAEALSKVLASGEIDAFIALVGNALAARDLGANAKWLVPEEGVYVAQDSAYVLKNLPADTTYYAELFINYLLDPDNQSLFAKDWGVIPVRSDVTLPKYMQGDPAFPVTEEDIEKYAVVIPEDAQAEGQTDWQAKYDRVFK